jgi:hypothetical protein
MRWRRRPSEEHAGHGAAGPSRRCACALRHPSGTGGCMVPDNVHPPSPPPPPSRDGKAETWRPAGARRVHQVDRAPPLRRPHARAHTYLEATKVTMDACRADLWKWPSARQGRQGQRPTQESSCQRTRGRPRHDLQLLSHSEGRQACVCGVTGAAEAGGAHQDSSAPQGTLSWPSTRAPPRARAEARLLVW